MNYLLYQYKNGNCDVQLFKDGTRIIEYPDNEDIKLDLPLNIDIRVSTKCSMGLNPKTNKSICSFCHESARTDGKDCNYEELLNILYYSNLPKGIELAIGVNHINNNLIDFLKECNLAGYICNITINQAHIYKYRNKVKYLIDNNYIYGLGISYRKDLSVNIPEFITEYNNTVLHIINGIDSIDDIYNHIPKYKFKKLLILGEKNFGFNLNKVDLDSSSHSGWRKKLNLNKLLSLYKVISFDNLALEQLDIKSKLPIDKWNSFYQGEHSIYINAIDKYYSISSRSPIKKLWKDISLKDFFKFRECYND